MLNERARAADNPHLPASGRSEGEEQRPVGFAGVEQGADAVVGEVGKPEGGAFDALERVAVAVAAVRTKAWRRRGDVSGPVMLDIDSTLVEVHSEKRSSPAVPV